MPGVSPRLRRAGVLLLVTATLALGALEVFCHITLKVRRRASPLLVSAHDGDPAVKAVAIAARDHARLEASLITPKQFNGKCVLALHGVGVDRSSMRVFVALFASQGYRVLAPDSRAHGASGGDLVTYGLLEKFDALDWAHWLNGNGCQAVYGFGESLGASILIQAAAAEPAFRSLVVECPYSDLKAAAVSRVLLYGHLPAWAAPVSDAAVGTAMLYGHARFGVDLTRVSPLTDIAHVLVPILLIHGLADNRTPPWHSEALQKAAPHAVLWLVPGARHSGASSTAPEEFNRRVLEWFAQS